MSALKFCASAKQFPLRYFQNYENQKSFLTDLGNKLHFTSSTDWYKLSTKELVQNGGKMLLRQYNDSPGAVVMGVFHEEVWQPWQFHGRLRFDWSSEPTKYMEYLYQQLHFKSMEDWYTLSTDDILAHNGASLLDKFGRSPSRMVMETLSDHPWQFWKFVNAQKYVWDNKDSAQQYITYLGEILGYKSPSDWYNISSRDFIDNFGEPLMKKFSHSPSRIVMHVFPDHPWLPFLFHPRSSTFKRNSSALMMYVQQLEEKMGIKSLEEWYRVERRDMEQHISKHFTDIGDFVAKVLQVAYPEQMWKVEKFENLSKSSTQHKLKGLLERNFLNTEVIENFPHPLQFFLGSGEIMTVDVFVPTLKLAFDYNGEQHYKQVSTHRSFLERQKFDSIKRGIFEKSGYKFVVVPNWWDGTLASLLPVLGQKEPA